MTKEDFERILEAYLRLYLLKGLGNERLKNR